MKNIKSTIVQLLFVSTFLLLSCGGGGSSTPPEKQPELPAKAVGTLPVNGEPCSDYSVVPNSDTQVFVTFKWNTAKFTESYILVITEGSTEVHRDIYNILEADVQLDRGKTYTWSVASLNIDGETKGDTYSFTTPGVPVGNYAPYAADITVEFDTDLLEMSVSWVGRDEEDEDLTYDVMVTENELVLIEELDYTLESIDPITFINGETYSIEVVSKDSSGNFSVSIKTEVAPE